MRLRVLVHSRAATEPDPHSRELVFVHSGIPEVFTNGISYKWYPIHLFARQRLASRREKDGYPFSKALRLRVTGMPLHLVRSMDSR